MTAAKKNPKIEKRLFLQWRVSFDDGGRWFNDVGPPSLNRPWWSLDFVVKWRILFFWVTVVKDNDLDLQLEVCVWFCTLFYSIDCFPDFEVSFIQNGQSWKRHLVRCVMVTARVSCSTLYFLMLFFVCGCWDPTLKSIILDLIVRTYIDLKPNFLFLPNLFLRFLKTQDCIPWHVVIPR